MAEKSKCKKLYVGKVISDKMDKTVVVKVQRIFKHPLLRKVVKVYKKYKVHDENSVAKMGDSIKFFEGRPVSKSKYMYLDSVESKASGVK
jgi:small subunit ribosomal protein S17